MDEKDLLMEMIEDVLFLTENLAAEKLALRHGVSIQKDKTGKVAVMFHPKYGRKVIRTRNGNIPHAEIQQFVRSKGKIQEGSEDPIMISPETNTLKADTAKLNLVKPNTRVECIKTSLVPFAGVRNGIAQVWKGDIGKVIKDDGNRLFVVMLNSGRVVFPKEDINTRFELEQQT